MKSMGKILTITGPEISTTPILPVTGYSNPKCYARALGDCNKKISVEHYVSRQVLELWSDKGIVTTNLPDLGNEKLLSEIPVKALGGKMLCERHNHALSGLDQVGVNFCRFIRNQPVQPKYNVLNGFDLERWMLKLFLGFSVIVKNQEYNIKDWQPPLEWLQLLFGEQGIADKGGLYSFTLNNVSRPGNMIKINYVSEKATGNEVGIIINLDGIVMFFGVSDPVPLPPNPHMEIFRRPKLLAIAEKNRTRELHTGWWNGVEIVLK